MLFLNSNVTLGAAAVFDVDYQNVIIVDYRIVTHPLTLRVDLHVLIAFVLERTPAVHVSEQLEVPLSFIGKNSHLVCLALTC
jgi:hypothetical protein